MLNHLTPIVVVRATVGLTALRRVGSRRGVQLQTERFHLAFYKREPRRERLNSIQEFGVALLARFDEVDRAREVFPGREPANLEPAPLIGSGCSDGS